MTPQQIARELDREAQRRFLRTRVAVHVPSVLCSVAVLFGVVALLAWGIVTVCNDIANGTVW